MQRANDRYNAGRCISLHSHCRFTIKGIGVLRLCALPPVPLFALSLDLQSDSLNSLRGLSKIRNVMLENPILVAQSTTRNLSFDFFFLKHPLLRGLLHYYVSLSSQLLVIFLL